MGKPTKRAQAAASKPTKASASGKKSSPDKQSVSHTWTVLLVLVLVGVALWSALPNQQRPRQVEPPSEEDVAQPADDSAGKSPKAETNPTIAIDDSKVGETNSDPEPIHPELQREKEWKPTTLSGLRMSGALEVAGRRLHPKQVKTRLREDGPKRRTDVKMYTLDHVLTDNECVGLIGAHDQHRQRMKDPIFCFDSEKTLQAHLKEHAQLRNLKLADGDFTEGTTCLNTTMSRVLDKYVQYSVSTAFYTGESKFSYDMDRRIEEATGMPASHGGKYQITSYSTGVGYKTHTDCRVESRDKRDRVATVLVYLNDVPSGGHTIFPELDVKIEPRRARGLIWNSMSADGMCDSTSVHNASMVESGRKVILQRWYYYNTFPMLGKRFDPPTIPAREDNQPFISCDQYDQGSCRMYDEWQYIHIKEYVRQQMSR
eukprot:scpid71910/ scgid13220/ Prolyl 4-hydroxylase subunit alpha-1; Procollagen-proline,2-oxoglutarate-4-dioxygenase subunit alpha-1